MYPKIVLAIDNCFASKRWTEPLDWMRLIKTLGITCVEASADNECDPLYMGPTGLANWVTRVRRASETTGVRVVNLYSGHGTYATLGLAHDDLGVRDRFLDQWLKPMARTAGALDAGLGFFCHAFSDAVLQDPVRYAESEADLYARLAALAQEAGDHGCRTIGVEQMYTPHQIPWTVPGARRLLHEVNRQTRHPFYLTIDTGHQCGQRRFLRPDIAQLRSWLQAAKESTPLAGMWLGPRHAFEMFEAARQTNGTPIETQAASIERALQAYPHLFAEEQDGDPYVWLETFGAYSPIIHLQQTTGHRSAHLPFTAEHNPTGIITAERVLAALRRAYEHRHPSDGMPPPCETLYLTLELFSGTADINRDILEHLRASVEYWRTAVPQDGLTLDQLTSGEYHP